MSSSNNSKKRNVHFPAGSITDEAPPQKRHRSGIDEENTEDRKPSALRPSTFTNNNKNNFNREDGDNEDPDGNDIPSKSELIEAKRKRRQIRGSGGALFNDDEDDHMDAAEKSLATDGVKIEPFHMRDEKMTGRDFLMGIHIQSASWTVYNGTNVGMVICVYFVGIQRVMIRTVQEEISDEKESLSTEEDLLNDLMDDDDDDDDKEEEEESRPNKKAKSTNCVTVKGEWMWSNEVDYQKYL
ncbi:hypothetical protein FRACYDRAFT_253286 [Fragilariopsis cylindrus CCMP1102]|uniref:Uncharacterized protein n=1 Tax=Fragilariopsis cylindrus CCMP1102 TaxID=635003 RepID=A0A1E7ELN3_9STRA|nr:hypothetical protein FRACYDRAFT_253286 [Fragilariopsis cylindrus CCMP1102]|eukprot:OEU06794.1 hypothetical protein FRACYDRAFT_253286 [Fragilariopsis cylindrus CCMP1102]